MKKILNFKKDGIRKYRSLERFWRGLQVRIEKYKMGLIIRVQYASQQKLAEQDLMSF